MRCPYCGRFNPDSASFCAACGRDLVPPTQSPSRQSSPPQAQLPPRPAYPMPGNSRPAVPSPAQTPPYTQPRPTPRQVPPQTPYQPPAQTAAGLRPGQQDVPVPSSPPLQESPVPFPPRDISQLYALEPYALPYRLVAAAVADGRKKIVRIVYASCPAWQQVATLLKVFHEQAGSEKEKFNSVIVQGVLEQDPGPYDFTNGQLRLDRKVLLGSQVVNRYQIETENGFTADSVRIVLLE